LPGVDQQALPHLIERPFQAFLLLAQLSLANDIDDLSRRLLLALGGIYANSLESLPPHTVLVARHLLPSDTVFLSRHSTVAVLAEFAGPAAHAALLARELGIPCVGGIPELLDRVHSGALARHRRRQESDLPASACRTRSLPGSPRRAAAA
jgi:phosphoenolpyruvate-protein kinase (PTS system EI component)